MKYKDRIKGGRGDSKLPSDFPKAYIEKGVAVEVEHTDDPMLAEEIAIDHLTEFPNYYEELERMENKLKKQNPYPRKYSDDFVHKLFTLHNEGLSTKEIGEELGLSLIQVSYILANYLNDRIKIKKRELDKEQIENVKSLYDKGMSYKDISIELKLPETDIDFILYKYYKDRIKRINKYDELVVENVKSLHDKGFTDKEIGAKLNIKTHTITSILHSRYSDRKRKLTKLNSPDVIIKIKNLHSQGLSIKEISNILNTKNANVYYAHKVLNLKPNKKLKETKKSKNKGQYQNAINKIFARENNISSSNIDEEEKIEIDQTIKDVFDLKEDGLSDKEIAEELEIEQAIVKRILASNKKQNPIYNVSSPHYNETVEAKNEDDALKKFIGRIVGRNKKIIIDNAVYKDGQFNKGSAFRHARNSKSFKIETNISHLETPINELELFPDELKNLPTNEKKAEIKKLILRLNKLTRVYYFLSSLAFYEEKPYPDELYKYKDFIEYNEQEEKYQLKEAVISEIILIENRLIGMGYTIDRQGKVLYERKYPREILIKQNPSTSFIPPLEVAKEAELGLKLRKEFNRGGTEVGVHRAVQLKNRQNLSEKTINRMASFFARHGVHEGMNYKENGEPTNHYIAWLLWGGDSGREWANKMKKKIKKNNPDITVNKETKKVYADNIEIKDIKVEDFEKNIAMLKLPNEGFFTFPPNSYYIYLTETEHEANLLKKQERDFPMFPIGSGLSMGYRNDPFKTFFKGKNADGIIGSVWFQVLDDEIFIEMMAVRPTHKKNQINTLMIKYIMNKFNKNKIDFGMTTPQGDKFIDKFNKKEKETEVRKGQEVMKKKNPSDKKNHLRLVDGDSFKIIANNKYSKIGFNEVYGLRKTLELGLKELYDFLNNKIYWGNVKDYTHDVEYISRDGFSAYSSNKGGIRINITVPKCEEYDWSFLEFGEYDESDYNEDGELNEDCDADGGLDSNLDIMFKLEEVEPNHLLFYIGVSGGNNDAPYFRSTPIIYETEMRAENLADLLDKTKKEARNMIKWFKEGYKKGVVKLSDKIEE